MAAIAALLGFAAAPPDRCRVLELGAGDGAHLIPLALGCPKSQFLGVDLAGRAIARGQTRIAELGLSNITLEQGDLSTFAAVEPFDYVIAHGVYSWLPPEVQEQLLATLKRALAPHGLVYLSYATYPGCHQREMVRNLMLFHTARLNGSTDVVAEGLEWLRFVLEHQTAGDAYQVALKQELSRMQRGGPGYTFHDDFSEYNSPVYFGELVERAQQHGLDFFAEGLFRFFDDPRLNPEVSAVLARLSGDDVVTREQYLDFMRGRAFRQTLFCHLGSRPSRAFSIDTMDELYAASALVSKTSGLDPRTKAVETFGLPDGVELSAESPFVRAALNELSRVWPCAIPVAELLRSCQAAVGPVEPQQPATDPPLLLRTLLRAAALKLVELDVAPPAPASAVTERPRASALARLEAAQGLLVTDLWLRRLKLEDEASRYLLTQLDGTHSHADLVQSMSQFFSQSSVGSAVQPPQIADDVARVLADMQKRALLQA